MVRRVAQSLARLRDDKSAVTAMEYALIGTFLCIAIITGVKTIAPPLNAMLVAVGQAL